jgi:hypothetical protein
MAVIPWWALAYLAGYGIMTIAGAVKDRRQPEPAWRIAGDLVTSAALLAMAAGYWYPSIISQLGRAAVPVLAGIVLWDMYSTSRDLSELGHDPELDEQDNRRILWLSIVLGATAIAPIYALSAFAALRPWSG